MKIEIKKLSVSELEERNVYSWPISESNKTEFNKFYEKDEYCYILDGSGILVAGDKEINVHKGDFVWIPKGNNCQWKVTNNIIRHYLEV